MNAHGGTASVRDQVGAAEWAMRVDLAAAYRLVADYGRDDLIFTHISARAPGSDHHFLINPYGMLFEEVTASSLVKVDLDGHKVMESPFDINSRSGQNRFPSPSPTGSTWLDPRAHGSPGQARR
jgi:class II aldolase/adducin N-terminal domain-containing protein